MAQITCLQQSVQAQRAWKLLMGKCRWILGFYGLENSTNQSTLLTVYLFRTFLFSKPSNVHLFHPAFGLVLYILIFPFTGIL